MNRYVQTSRSAFSHQPAQYLIIDIGYSMNNLILESCIAALQTVLSLACSIRGGNRIPGFALSVIGAYPRCIFPLDIIRGNFRKLEEALNSIFDLIQTDDKTEGFDDNLFQSLLTALDDFKSKSDNSGGNNIWQFSSQLQITVLTTKPGLAMQECLEQAVQNVSTTRLKKIMVVELRLPLSEITETNYNQPFDLSKTLGFVEVVQIYARRENLEDFFKQQWLLDCNTDTEHLRIIFPNGVTNENYVQTDNNFQNQNFVLKCDVSECIINPNSLPFGNRFTIQTDFSVFQLGGSMLGKSQGSNLTIYELFVVARLSSGGVCESLLFGQPLHLYPTQCWRLEWTKLLANQQVFMALCKDLMAKDEFLLTQLKPHLHSDKVSGYFILVPGETSFLLKAVAPRELVLPDKITKPDKGSTIDEIPQELSTIISSLKNLPFLPEYDPQFWESELCSSLIKNLQNSSDSVHAQDKDSKDIIKTKVSKPNVIVTNVINRFSSRGRGQKRVHVTTNKRQQSPTENSK